MIRPGNGNHESAIQWRDNPDAGSGWSGTLAPANPLPWWIRGEYDNGQFWAYFAPDEEGEPGDWVMAAGSPHTLNTLGQDTILAGIAVTSHDDNQLVTAEFTGVEFIQQESLKGLTRGGDMITWLISPHDSSGCT